MLSRCTWSFLNFRGSHLKLNFDIPPITESGLTLPILLCDRNFVSSRFQVVGFDNTHLFLEHLRTKHTHTKQTNRQTQFKLASVQTRRWTMAQEELKRVLKGLTLQYLCGEMSKLILSVKQKSHTTLTSLVS